jgi:choline dehydrogenase-like flavoprotein
MNLNLDAQKQNTFDAIVVGSGISGGWAAKELTEKGLKTLVLERGRDVRHVVDYPTMSKDPWQLPHGGRLSTEETKLFPVQQRTGWIGQGNKHFFVNDLENPYDEAKPFDWIRGYQVGGRSITWGKQTYRWSDLDFEANAKDGHGVDWPIRYKDLAPWYDYVESYIGVSGQAEGLPQLPDGKFLPPMELNCVEQQFRDRVAEKFSGRKVTIGRVAHLTAALPHDPSRGVCQSRNMCDRGCPYGAYFSSNASTLPAAQKTGNLTLRPFSIVHSIIYDEQKGKAVGVKVIDAQTKEEIDFFAKVIFLNASALGSTFILLNSISSRFPNGMGNGSDQLGRNLMDHQYRAGAGGDMEGFEDKYYIGRRPNGFYIPRFRNIGNDKRDYLRGFGYQGGAGRSGWQRGVAELAFGSELKEQLKTPGGWTMGMSGFGECLPYADNRVTLNPDKKDPYGLPMLRVDAEWKENEKKMREDMKTAAAEMLEAAGFKNVNTYDNPNNIGLGIHEMGTARMGKDPKTSVLNKWNQVHEAPNVFVTDGACMTSSACQNPSLTYMALTARAVNYAVAELKKGNIS